MKIKTEIVLENKKALIISSFNYPFIKILKENLEKFSVEIFFSSKKPKNFDNFDYIFLIDEYISDEIIKKNKNKKYIAIFIKKSPPSHLLKINLENIKIIKFNKEKIKEEEIDKILWFAFSSSSEKFLRFDYPEEKQIKKEKQNKIRLEINKKIILKIIIFFIIIQDFLFIPFLAFSYFFVYKSLNLLKKEKYQQIEKELKKADIFYKIGKNFYKFSEKNYKFIGLSPLTENLISINDYSIKALSEINEIIKNFKKAQQLIFIKNKSKEEKEETNEKIVKIKTSIKNLNQYLTKIIEKLNLSFESTKKIKKNILETKDSLEKIEKIYEYFQKNITENKNHKYLIFFVNNMEIRPGGGFLGSFAILEIGDLEIKELKIYDVYDADGQLTFHLDPPEPFKKYLNLPHWFLRDSNFSPDFFENYQKALFFIEKELKISNFNGALLLTTTAVENILDAFDYIYLPDYKEYITSKNFYIKTQLYVEKNFFPGSIQKKTFLSKLINQTIINLDKASILKLFKNLKKSLDEKQIVLYLEDDKIQSLIDSQFWSGRVIKNNCLIQNQECINDYLFPYETNVGANKANFFINSFFYLKTNINSSSNINHQLVIKYENNSPSEIFPTGYYKNYFQILLPKNAMINSIIKDGELIKNYSERDDDIFKILGFYFEIPPKKTSEIKINYFIPINLKKGKQIYQLIFQKQIGAKNYDLILNFDLDEKISIINQNFPALVKNNQIIYNTNLSTDKIFLIEVLNR